MESQGIKTGMLSIAGLAIGIIALFTEEYRILLISLSAVFLTTYFLSAYITKIENHEERLKKTEEKLKIHEQLTIMKAEILNLQERCKIR